MQNHLHTGFVELAITTGFVLVAIHVLRAAGVWLSARDSDMAQTSGKIIGSLTTFSNT